MTTPREIKFRAWDKETKQMHQVKELDLNNYTAGLDKFTWREWKDLELMQYTGLKDNNGKEIYEGDILELRGAFTLTEPAIREVKRDDEGGYLPFSEKWASGGQVVSMYNKNTAEVIGNIYENPELLER